MNVHTTQQLVVTGILMLIAVSYHRLRKETLSAAARAARTDGTNPDNA